MPNVRIQYVHAIIDDSGDRWKNQAAVTRVCEDALAISQKSCRSEHNPGAQSSSTSSNDPFLGSPWQNTKRQPIDGPVIALLSAFSHVHSICGP